MAVLLYESKLNSALEDIIREAESYIIFMCPYFKLHDRLKDCLKLQKSNSELQIIIIFGKNEYEPTKSLSKDDLEFLKLFPNITISYEKRLHAKYYANEKFGLITSINLYSFSINNNIEVGVFFKQKEGIGLEADSFFDDVYENAETIFQKVPKYETKAFGFKKNYLESEVTVDNSKRGLKTFENGMTNKVYNRNVGTRDLNQTKTFSNNVSNQNHNSQLNTGFCIRTNKQIPFDSYKPMSLDSFLVWVEYSNQDFPENYCHRCGNKAKTTMRNPLCRECKKAMTF